MNIYTAIMKAADWIESHPSEFKFFSISVPDAPGCGTPGCAIGWIGTFAGNRKGFTRVYSEILGVGSDIEFYSRMDKLSAPGAGYCDGTTQWRHQASECGRVLRLYAAKYHAPAKPAQQPPDWQAMAAVQTVAADVRSQEVAS